MMMQFPSAICRRVSTFALAALLAAQTLSPMVLASPRTGDETARLADAQAEPEMAVTRVDAQALDEHGNVIPATVDQYEFTFSTVPTTSAEMAQYEVNSAYKAMALLIMALRAWTPENPTPCLEMLDYLTDTGATISGTGESCPFSRYNPWIDALRDRMLQNDKWKYIGNAYLKGAAPENNYTPMENTITLRQSVYDPYAEADEWGPEQTQVLVFFPGADEDQSKAPPTAVENGVEPPAENTDVDATPESFLGEMENVFCAVYDRNGGMICLQTWEKQKKDPYFCGSVRIPPGKDVAEIKFMILDDNLAPTCAAQRMG